MGASEEAPMDNCASLELLGDLEVTRANGCVGRLVRLLSRVLEFHGSEIERDRLHESIVVTVLAGVNR